MVRRLAPYLQPARGEMLAGGCVLLCATVVDLLQPWPIKWLVDYVFGTHTAQGWVSSLWPSLASHDMARGIAAVCITILTLAVVHRIGVMIGHFFLLRAGARVVQQLRCHACD